MKHITHSYIRVTSEHFATNKSFSDFFDQLELPSLSEEAKADLDSPITTVEISEAIDKMKGGKAPGPVQMGYQLTSTKFLRISYYHLYWICL